MSKTADQVQGLLGTAAQRARLVRGEDVEMHLDTGEVLSGTLTSLRSQSATATRITARSKTWSRWRGTPDDLIALLKKAATEITNRSPDPPPISVRINLGANDEERYFDIPSFEREIHSTEPGTPGTRLREIQQIEISVGPTRGKALKANATFSQNLPAPGVVLAMEGADRAVVNGVKDELATTIQKGRPRVPMLNGPAQMFISGLIGAAYSIGIYSIDWSFLGDGWLGTILLLLLYLGGFIALLYVLTAGLRLLLPPLTLAQPGQTPSEKWRGRIVRVGGAVALAGLPFLLDRVFG